MKKEGETGIWPEFAKFNISISIQIKTVREFPRYMITQVEYTIVYSGTHKE